MSNASGVASASPGNIRYLHTFLSCGQLRKRLKKGSPSDIDQGVFLWCPFALTDRETDRTDGRHSDGSLSICIPMVPFGHHQRRIRVRFLILVGGPTSIRLINRCNYKHITGGRKVWAPTDRLNAKAEPDSSRLSEEHHDKTSRKCTKYNQGLHIARGWPPGTPLGMTSRSRDNSPEDVVWVTRWTCWREPPGTSRSLRELVQELFIAMANEASSCYAVLRWRAEPSNSPGHLDEWQASITPSAVRAGHAATNHGPLRSPSSLERL